MTGAVVDVPRGMFVRYEARRSRRVRWCSGDHGHDRTIRVGEVYVVARQYPGHDAGHAAFAGHPVDWALCATCAAGYGLGELVTARKGKR